MSAANEGFVGNCFFPTVCFFPKVGNVNFLFFLLLLPSSRWLRSCLFSSCSTSPASSFSSSSSSDMSSANEGFVGNCFFPTVCFFPKVGHVNFLCLFSSCSTSP